MNQGGMLKPALIAGVLLGILSVIPGLSLLNCFCCAWVVGGGAFASHLYVKDSPVAVTLGKGALLGLVTGAIGAVTCTVFNIPLQLLMSALGMDVVEHLRQLIGRMPDIPPEQRDALGKIAQGGISFILVVGIASVVPFSMAGMAGGAIGVALFEKRPRSSEPASSFPEPPVAPPPLQ